MDIILDTDFIIKALEFKIDVFSELNRICDFKFNIKILDKTLDELKGKKGSKLALRLIKDKKIKVVKTKKDKIVDDLILEINNSCVATQDKELKKKLRDKRVKVITIRQKKYLVIE